MSVRPETHDSDRRGPLPIPHEYLSLTLHEVLVLTGRAVVRGELCTTSTIAGAVETMARTLAAADRERKAASDRAWLARLARQIEALDSEERSR